MSSPDDDLHGRQLALLLLFFTTVGAALYPIVGNPVVCAAIAGGGRHGRGGLGRPGWLRRLGALLLR